jgi:glycosyltransferase involved in cell wall biosynthesis
MAERYSIIVPLITDTRTDMQDSMTPTQGSDAPALSVLVPIYNVERYLEECLESIHNQSFADFEVICINDGSTDGSRAIIDSYMKRDRRFRIIDKPNSGYGASMNQGLEAATGTFVGIVESDDFIDPETLKILYTTALEFDAEVVKANCYFYWSTPHHKNELFELVPASQVKRLVNPQEERDIFYLKPSIWSAIYRRDFLNKNTIRFLETPGASYQDAGFNFKVWVSATRAVFLKEAYLHYRQDNESSSVNSPSKVYCVCDEYEEMTRYLDERPQQKVYLDPVKTKMRYDSYMWNYERLVEQFQVSFLKRFKEDFDRAELEGTLDLELFEPWKILDLQTIRQSPALYHAQRTSAGNHSRLGKALHYYRVGGLSLLVRIAKNKLLRG